MYEAGKKALAKVAVTGGGRCNLTNSFAGTGNLSEAYPRGATLMKRLLKGFGSEDCMAWFEERGVRLITQEDHCVFPRSQDAMEIVRTLLSGLGKAGDPERVRLHTSCPVSRISAMPGGGFLLESGKGEREYDIVIVTTGGMQKKGGVLDGLGIGTVPPVPSLFTFTLKDPVTRMMGTVVEASVSIPGTKFKAAGPLLITDWGMSGPAILKLSSYAARELHEREYKAPLAVNWLSSGEEEVRAMLRDMSESCGKKLMRNAHPDRLPSRLWCHLLEKSGIREDMRWAELGKNGTGRLCGTLRNDSYSILGRTRFREEFVTCGGISLSELDPATLEIRKYPGLYSAGEILDIDAVTGGFNLQAAWTTGYTVAMAVRKRL